MAKPKILIIYTGGTIGMGKDPMTGVLEPLDFNHLVSSMPEFSHIDFCLNELEFGHGRNEVSEIKRFQYTCHLSLIHI